MTLNSLSSHRNQEPESGTLYLVSTPIGNLNDISFRALNIIKNVSLIACEDTRNTLKILKRYEISKTLMSFNKHNSYSKIKEIIEKLKNDSSIALVSDAGVPAICDPGEDLIRAARINNLDVICIPGPCAAITALASSGFSSSKFIFEGFLPKNKLEREKLIIEISKHEKTTILFESPHRLKKLLKELKEICGGSKQIQVSKELTKKFEQHFGPDIDTVIKTFDKEDEIKGEFTIVIKGIRKIQDNNLSNFELRKELDELIQAGLTLPAASKYLARKSNLTKSQIYNLY